MRFPILTLAVLCATACKVNVNGDDDDDNGGSSGGGGLLGGVL